MCSFINIFFLQKYQMRYLMTLCITLEEHGLCWFEIFTNESIIQYNCINLEEVYYIGQNG